ncbi:MAG: SDR family oxidoreductase [Candidatus Nanopelagicaceae bacterium]|nr:SDR family oxidoreductase [Candidatus Nanopelagicaceae bacterium]
MIFFIGANAALTAHLLRHFEKEEVVLVGRKRPASLAGEFSGRDIGFIDTNYHDAPSIAAQISSNSNIVLVFVGIGTEPMLLKDISHEQLTADLESNLEFPTLLIKDVLLKMIQQNFGRVIFIGSKESSRGVAGGSIYAMIKSAQAGLSRTIAVEYAKFGITSNVLQLGLLDFGYSQNLPQKNVEALKLRIPTATSLDPKDIASVIRTLIGAPSINGTVIDIDQSVR